MSLVSCEEPREEIVPEIKIPEASQELFDSGIDFDASDASIQPGQQPSESGVLVKQLQFTATDAWSAAVTDTKAVAWLTLVPDSGDAGDVTMTVTAQPNTSPEPRSVTVTIRCGTISISFTVSQAGYMPVTPPYDYTGQENGHYYVDMGLPSDLLWAVCNVGATKPEDYGDYFAWGETEPYYTSQDPLAWKDGKSSGYSWQSYKWCNGSGTTLTKYNKNSSYGPVVDNKITLEMEDDAARANWGGKWRMPTKAEFVELLENCTFEWTSLNGVYGAKITSKNNGNSIFLPATGSWCITSLESAGLYAEYWASSLQRWDEPYYAETLFIRSGYVESGFNGRSIGRPVRPVTGEDLTVGVTSVALSKSSLTLMVGEEEELSAIVKPDDATYKTVTWSCSNYDIAWATSGVVKARAPGTAIITVTTDDGYKTATCTVTVEPRKPLNVNGHEYVDLGLPSGLMWATCNVGADNPEEYGDYFAWGETEPYYTSQSPLTWKSGKTSGYAWASYKWCNGSDNTLTKYNNDSSYGTVDNKTTLDIEDDAASANWGGSWRMPTHEDVLELLSYCTTEWTTQNGVNGSRITSNRNGNSIFLPAAGRLNDTHLSNTGSYGIYWSSSLHTNGTYCASTMSAGSSGYGYGSDSRYYGHTVRPVAE